MKTPYIRRQTINSYYMFGKHPVFAALNNPARTIEKILCTTNIYNSYLHILKNNNTEIVDSKAIDKILKNDYNHQGIIAKVNTVFLKDLNEIDFSATHNKIVILDQVTDSHNIGAIIRSAVAFGINYILIPSDNSPIENGLIAKAAAGMLESIKIINVINIRSTIEILKKKGFWVIGLDVDGKEKFSSDIFTNKSVIILGSEDKGMRKLTKDSCDYLVRIPLKNKVESLNVSTAASIFFYISSTY